MQGCKIGMRASHMQQHNASPSVHRPSEHHVPRPLEPGTDRGTESFQYRVVMSNPAAAVRRPQLLQMNAAYAASLHVPESAVASD
jgi:hypothetical protein